MFFNRGYYNLYPNFYIVLVAGSARCRKSTALGIGARLLSEIPDIRFLNGKASPEKFVHELEFVAPEELAVPGTVINADELSVLLTRDSTGDRMMDLLTKLYDCPARHEYKTFTHGDKIIRNVFITIFAGTTPESLAKSLPDAAFGGGFTSRIIFVFEEDTPKRNPLPELDPALTQMQEDLVNRLKQIQKMKGEFKLSDVGRDYYIDWYHKLQPPEDSRLDGFFGRKHDHLLRLGMVLAADRGGTLVNEMHLDAANNALNAIEAGLPDAFQAIGLAKSTDNLERIKRQLQKFKRISHSELLKKNYRYVAKTEFRELMDTLIDSNIAMVDPNVTKGVFYVWIG